MDEGCVMIAGDVVASLPSDAAGRFCIEFDEDESDGRLEVLIQPHHSVGGRA